MSSVSGRLAGKVIVVTGAAQGIGAATVERLRASGATVIATDRHGSEVDLDVTSESDWRRLATLLRTRATGPAAGDGHVDGLVCCAGITRRARLDDVTVDDMTEAFRVNVVGALLGIQALVPLMRAGSSIVLIGSLAAQTAHYPTAYTTSKWALRGLAHNAALALGERGIRVNTVHPGFVDTPMTASAVEAFRASSLAETPLGRAGTAGEIAATIEFLLSDDASYICGSELAVDGGAASHGGVKSISDALQPHSPATTNSGALL